MSQFQFERSPSFLPDTPSKVAERLTRCFFGRPVSEIPFAEGLINRTESQITDQNFPLFQEISLDTELIQLLRVLFRFQSLEHEVTKRDLCSLIFSNEHLPMLHHLMKNIPLRNWLSTAKGDMATSFVFGKPYEGSLLTPTFTIDELHNFVESPNLAAFITRFHFLRICLVRCRLWHQGRYSQKRYFSIDFLANFPDFTEVLVEYAMRSEHHSFETVSDLGEGLDTFDKLMATLGRAGVTDRQISDQLVLDFQQQQQVHHPDFEWDSFSELQSRNILNRMRTGLTLANEWVLRQKILDQQGLAPEHRPDEQLIARMKFLESANNPLRHLYITHGYEIEYLEHWSNPMPPGQRSDQPSSRDRAVMSGSIYDVLDRMKIIHLGNDAGEISPQPNVVPEHTNLMFRRLLDAGLLDVHSFFYHSCHINLGVSTLVGFSALTNMMRSTCYSFAPFPLPQPNSNEVFAPEIVAHSKYFENKNFRFLSPDFHQRFVSEVVKLGQALAAAEKMMNWELISTTSGNVLPSEVLKALSFGQIEKATFMSDEEKELAKIWIVTFEKYRRALAQLNIDDQWRPNIPAVQEFSYQNMLQTIFPSLQSQMLEDRVNQAYALRSPHLTIEHKRSEVTIDGHVFPNLVAFTRFLTAEAAKEVDQVLENGYRKLAENVEQICLELEQPNLKKVSARGKLLVGNYLNNYTVHLFDTLEVTALQHYFFQLRQQLRDCGLWIS